MRVVWSVIYGYLGAILGGLLVAVVGVALGLSQESIVAASVPTGVVFGALGLTLIWWRPIAGRTLVPAARSSNRDRVRR
jgi:cation transporter-like permease